jgi:hypothetical protein
VSRGAAAIALLLAALGGCGVKAPPRAAGAPDSVPPSDLFRQAGDPDRHRPSGLRDVGQATPAATPVTTPAAAPAASANPATTPATPPATPPAQEPAR